MKPQRLTPGDTLFIAAPAGPFDRRKFLAGVAQLQKNGFRVRYRSDIFKRLNYLAGDDRRRLVEIQEALTDPRSKAVLFARGGYGCQRLLTRLPRRIRPKILVGSSDLTVILNDLWKRFGLPSFYGPMVAPHLGDPKNAARLKRALTDPDFFQKQILKAKKIIRPGKAQGVIAGGCLSLIASTLGTPGEIDTKGKILVLEDTHEEPYRIDRLLTQMDQSGKFRGVRGIVLGTFRLRKVLFPSSIERVVRDRLNFFSGPILWGVRFGHCPDPKIIPLGVKARIQGDRLLVTQKLWA